MKNNKPKILIFDVETSYLEGYMWGLYDQNFAPNQLKENEWSIIAFAAKWLGSKDIIYHDNRKKHNKRDDKEIVKKLRDLIDEADIILTKNGKRFDEKIFNSRCAKHHIKQPSSYRHIDVEKIVRRKFKLPSYSLDYLCKYFNTPRKKLAHKAFPGMELWVECMHGNKKAWKEMELYNKVDVLSTEDVYNIVAPWDNSVNFSVYSENIKTECSCGGKLIGKGYAYTASGQFQRYICVKCGKNYQGRQNLFSKEKRKSLLK